MKQSIKTFSILCVQYEGQSDDYKDALDYMNMIFTGVFTIEFILKLIAFRVKVSITRINGNITLLSLTL